MANAPHIARAAIASVTGNERAILNAMDVFSDARTSEFVTGIEDGPPDEVPAPWGGGSTSAVPKFSLLTTLPTRNNTYLFLYDGSVVEYAKQHNANDATHVIVNAANEAGVGGSGIDKAINDAGGSSLIAERVGRMNGRGPIRTGEGFVTTSGHIGTIIHVVGPDYTDASVSVLEGDALLEATYVFAIAAARSLENKGGGIEQIGFPFISAGVYRGTRDLDEIVAIAINTLVEWATCNVMLFAFTREEVVAVRRHLAKPLADAQPPNTTPDALRQLIIDANHAVLARGTQHPTTNTAAISAEAGLGARFPGSDGWMDDAGMAALSALFNVRILCYEIPPAKVWSKEHNKIVPLHPPPASSWRDLSFSPFSSNPDHKYETSLFVYNKHNGHFQYFEFTGDDVAREALAEHILGLQKLTIVPNAEPPTEESANRAVENKRDNPNLQEKWPGTEFRKWHDDGRRWYVQDSLIHRNYEDASQYITLKNVNGDGNCGYWAFMAAMEEALGQNVDFGKHSFEVLIDDAAGKKNEEAVKALLRDLPDDGSISLRELRASVGPEAAGDVQRVLLNLQKGNQISWSVNPDVIKRLRPIP